MQKYSFLMCVYFKDNPAFLAESIDSMLNQTVPPDEIVIVEDGPLTEGLYSVIKKYSDRFPQIFTIIRNQVNLGLGKALNEGIAHARNELLARMDADDISEKERCCLQLKAFEDNPELDIVGTSTCAFINDPQTIVSINHAACTLKEIYKRGKRHAAFSHVTVMYRKSTLQKLGGYGDYRRAQDADLFGRMLFSGCKAMNIDKILVKVRKGNGLVSRKKDKTNIDSILNIKKSQKKMGYISQIDYISLWFKYKVSLLIPNKLYQKLYLKMFGNQKNLH